MKTYYLIYIALIFAACVKTPNRIDSGTSNIFTVKVVESNKDISSATLTADNSLRYTFRIKNTSSTQIDDSKQMSVSVSDGYLSNTPNFASTAQQTTLTIQGDSTTCYFTPGRKAQPNAKLSISIGNVNQAFTYSIDTSEPDSLKLSSNAPYFAPLTSTATIVMNTFTLTAYLLKNPTNAVLHYASDNLQVSFEVKPNTINDTVIKIVPVQPKFSYSSLDASSSYEIATKVFSVTPNKGTLKAIAKYVKQNGNIKSDSILITFH